MKIPCYLNPMIHALTSEQLVSELKEIETQERGLEEDALVRLTELHRRGYAITAGYPSLFEFCVKVLGYSQGKASRRTQGLKFLESMSDAKASEVKMKMKEGKLSLTHLCQLQSVARKEKLTVARREEMITKLEGTSVRGAERILVSEFGVEAVARESVRPLSESASKLSVVVDQETLGLLEEFKNLTAHQNPQGSTAEALKLALKLALQKKRPTVPAPVRSSAPPSLREARLARGRLRALVWRRDQGRCRICGSKYMLEVDHVVPYSKGGKTELKNLRILCRAHDQNIETDLR